MIDLEFNIINYLQTDILVKFLQLYLSLRLILIFQQINPYFMVHPDMLNMQLK